MKLVVQGYSRHLFDLAEDPGESRDIADLHPRTLDRLTGLLADWDAKMSPGE